MDNKKIFREELELQLQLVEDQEESLQETAEEKEQREFEKYLRSLASRVEYVFDRSRKFYWN